MTIPTPTTTEPDGGSVIFVNQPEITDGWTSEETANFRDWLARMAPIWRAMVPDDGGCDAAAKHAGR